MIGFVSLSLPIFGVVVLGWAAVKMQLTPPAAIEALGAFSFRFALPALVVRLMASEPLGRSFNPLFFAGYLASGSLVFALIFGVSYWLERQTPPVAGARATSATVSNLGFLGPPLILAYFGQRGAGPLAMAIIAEVGILMSIGAVIMAGTGTGGGGVGRLAVRSTVCNPVIVAIIAGALSPPRVPRCARKTFAERLGSVASTSARRTTRLGDLQRHVAFALGGEAASRLSKRLAIPTSPDTLLRMAAKPAMAETPPPTPKILGVDDWAWRRGLLIGTGSWRRSAR